MSLKQFLVEQDRVNFTARNGNFSAPMAVASNTAFESRKRKLGEVEITDDADGLTSTKK